MRADTAADDFQLRLQAAARATEARLNEALASASATPERLAAAMRSATLGGGKRLRPFLVIECARLFTDTAEPALTTAAALECIHCYSLVHDDLPAMDNDTLRRGRPTVWCEFDEWTAILAGDGLLTLAFEMLAAPSLAEPARQLELLRKLAVASGPEGMVGGQCLDLEADKLGHPTNPAEAHVRQLQTMKTGALIAFAAEAGAIAGGADAEQRDRLAGFGRELGLAFQIADDLLDAEGDAATMGKAAGKDAAAGKATLVSLLGLEPARRELQRAHSSALAHLTPFGDRAATLQAVANFVVSRDH